MYWSMFCIKLTTSKMIIIYLMFPVFLFTALGFFRDNNGQLGGRIGGTFKHWSDTPCA